MKDKRLIILPGLGNRLLLYKAACILCSKKDREVIVYPINWQTDKASFDGTIRNLDSYIQQYEGYDTAIIGVSAGGTLAVNMFLKYPSLIRNVITIATPYYPVEIPNSLLTFTLTQMINRLKKSKPFMKKRIISVHGAYDETISKQKSIYKGIQHIMLPTIGHGPTIALGLTYFLIADKRIKNIMKI